MLKENGIRHSKFEKSNVCYLKLENKYNEILLFVSVLAHPVDLVNFGLVLLTQKPSILIFRFLKMATGSFCQKDQVSALSSNKRNICLNEYAMTSEGKVCLQSMDAEVI